MSKSVTFVGKKIDDFMLMNVIGTGAFGQVFEAQNIQTKESAAIKAVPKIKLKEHNGLVGELLQTEVSVLMQCNNVNVVKMLKYLESENNCYLVMEFCNEGDFDKLWKRRNKTIPEREAIQFLKQILNGMKGLHELNVIHRDIKLENILVHKGVLKIGDLGFAKRLTDKDQKVSTALGTLGTMAPEVIEFKPYGMLADMFSLGAIYYQMIFGILPFSIKSYEEFLKDVKQNKPNFNRNGISISAESKDLLTRMLQFDPNQRIKWTNIYDHELFREKAGMGDLNQKVTISSIAAKQVDIKQNDKTYKQNQQQMEKVTGDNMFKMLQTGNKQAKQIKEEDQVQIQQNNEIVRKQQQEYEQALKEQQIRKEKENEINRTLELYLGQRNALIFLARTLDSLHKIVHSQQTNVYLPAFMLIKKLMLENTNLINQIKNNQNIFNCKYLSELYNDLMFQNFFKMLQEESLIIADHFNIIQAQCQDIFQKMSNPNPKIKAELSIYATQFFEDNYKDTLINYYFQLQEEKEMQKNHIQKNNILNMLLYTLDALGYNIIIKQKGKINEIDSHFEQYNFLDERDKEKLMEEKFAQIF